MDKLYSLQILRGFAAWLVVFHHYMQLFYNFKADSLLGKILHTRGSFGVDLFFVLSGFVMFIVSKRGETTAFSFFMKRIIRVLPAYWFYTSILILLLLAFPAEFSFTDFNSESLLKSYLLIPSMNPSGIGVIPFLTVGWTLVFEIIFYTTLALSIFISKKDAAYICLIIIGTSPFVFPQGNVYSHILGEFKIYQFLVGVVIGIYYKSIYYNKINSVFTPAYQGIMLLLSAIFILSGIYGYGLPYKTVAAGFIVLAFILIDTKVVYSGRIAKFLIKQGDYSYSIYLGHVLVIGVFLHFFGNALDWLQESVMITLLIVSVYYTSAFSYQYIENGLLATYLKRILIK